MPSVALTPQQKEEQALVKRAMWLADGLSAYKRHEHLTVKQLAKAVDLGDKVVSKVLDGDYTIRLPIKTLWKLEAIARMAYRKSQEGEP